MENTSTSIEEASETPNGTLDTKQGSENEFETIPNGLKGSPKSKRRRRSKKTMWKTNASDFVHITAENSEQTESRPKLDAFQLMMNSRKSSDSGSPKKDCSVLEVPQENGKPKRKPRNSSLNRPGGAKRMRLNNKEETIESDLKSDEAVSTTETVKESVNEVATEAPEAAVVVPEAAPEKVVEEIEKEISTGGRKNRRQKKPNRLSLTKSKTENQENEAAKSPKNSWSFKIKLNVETASQENLEKVDTPSVEAKDVKLAPIFTKSTKSPETPEINNSRRVLRPRKPATPVVSSLVIENAEKPIKKERNKRNIKTPKPQEDPEVVEARRQFLLSDIPSSHKKVLVKSPSQEEALGELRIFPEISHVQQKTDSQLWNLPIADLKLKPDEETVEVTRKYQDFTLPKTNIINTNLCDGSRSRNLILEHVKVADFKKFVRQIKTHNPQYPVYKCYNFLYRKVYEEATFTRGRHQQSSPLASPTGQSLMWTEKYKAISSSEIIGNSSTISGLKEWLRGFQHFKTRREDSESEFDSDSRDSSRKRTGNIAVLSGPSGSGKTSAVYAICQDLGYEVLEVNASSKRTGKWLLQELQEATQSHQLRERPSIMSLMTGEPKKQTTKNGATQRKICVLLVEDVDVVFDQDEGFIPALNQISGTSKRPIVLTSTDRGSSLTKKFMDLGKVFTFAPLSPKMSAVWLQLVCLVEGMFLDSEILGDILQSHNGDIRKTLLSLQFWTTSTEDMEPHLEAEISKQNISETDENSEVVNDISGLEDCSSQPKFENSVSNVNLETLWWNVPKILAFPTEDIQENPRENRKENLEKLNRLFDFYDDLSLVDTLVTSHFPGESIKRQSVLKIKDSLELEDCKMTYQEPAMPELALFLVNSKLSTKIDVSTYKFQSPDKEKERLYTKVISGETSFKDILPVCSEIDRKPAVLDYFPYLRQITRSELKRAAGNKKRGNRFYSYMRHLGVTCSDLVYKTMGGIFK